MSADDPRAGWEGRVSDLLGELTGEPAAPPDSLPAHVMRTARWQYAARGTLLAMTQVVGALAQGTALVLGLGAARDEQDRS